MDLPDTLTDKWHLTNRNYLDGLRNQLQDRGHPSLFFPTQQLMPQKDFPNGIPPPGFPPYYPTGRERDDKEGEFQMPPLRGPNPEYLIPMMHDKSVNSKEAELTLTGNIWDYKRIKTSKIRLHDQNHPEPRWSSR